VPESRWQRLVPAVVAGVVLLVGLGSAVAVILTARYTTGLEAESRTRGVAANAVPVVAATLRTTLTDVDARGGSAAQQVPFGDAEKAGIPMDLAVQARDRGHALLVETGAVVGPVYSTPQPPEGVAARRAAITGLYVVPVKVGPTLDRLQPKGGGVAVLGPSRTVASVGGRPPDGAAVHAVPLSTALATGWTVRVWTPGAKVPVTAWLVAALCALAGLAGARYVVRRATEVRATDLALDRLRRQSTVLTGLAGVAQRSLDLADVLPAVSTQLSDALGLRGLSLTHPSREGERAFFRHGQAPAPVKGRALPESVPAGEAVSLLLSRGSRTVARLNVQAGRALDAEDLVTLEAAGEILTSALTNAEAFAQQRDALQRLRSVDELKTVFLATASHELRTPVGVISGFAELLATYVDALDHDKVRDYAVRINTTAHQLASLVENLLDFSRMERGISGDQEQAVLDLGAVVQRILDEHQDLGANHEVQSSIHQDVHVLGTPHAVERVLTNLVGNAAKYSPAGTTIRVLVREEAGRAVLHVDDEGAGVAPADRDQVFSRFYRGHGDAVTNTRGAGLGLAIVHEFATSMGGVATVAEAPTGGARFTVTFPLADPTAPTGATDSASSAGSTGSTDTADRVAPVASTSTTGQGATDVLT
jgi:signal transduction histidine kinase